MHSQDNLNHIVGVFELHQKAQVAVEKILAAGVPKDNVSVLANMGMTDTEDYTHSKDASVASGVTKGVTWGGLGGLALGLMALVSPGVLVAGPLAIALAAAGAGVGAIGGGIVGAMNQLGVPDEHANMYHEAVERGGTVVSAFVPDGEIEMTARLMKEAGALNVNTHAPGPMRPGWQEVPSAAHPEAEPPSPGNQIV